MSRLLTFSLVLLTVANFSNAYWLMGLKNTLTIERIDPIVNPGAVSGHVHTVFGGSNFRFNTTTESLRNSLCTSTPIVQDKSNYWFPHLYFQWANGSFTSLSGGAVVYYLFSGTPGTTTAFPDNFRMISGDPTLRGYDPTSFAQQAVTFLCLDFNGVSTRHNELPAKTCPSGIRAQINFPSCWDGKNADSPTHKSHVAFLSGGPDSGTCSDPNFPVTLPRIFMEMYWNSNTFDGVRNQAMNTTQPFVYSMGDSTGYGYHADYINGWDQGVLQKAVDNCHCNEFGDPTCCAAAGIFTLDSSQECHITKSVDEVVEGTLAKLPGNNPVRGGAMHVPALTDPVTPPIISPVCAYVGKTPPATCGSVVTPAMSAAGAPTSAPVVGKAAGGLPVSSSSSSTSTPLAPTTPASSPAASKPVLPVVPVNKGNSNANGDSGHVSPSASPTPAHGGSPPDNSTGSQDDDGDEVVQCTRSRKSKKSSHRPRSRDISRRFDHAF